MIDAGVIDLKGVFFNVYRLISPRPWRFLDYAWKKMSGQNQTAQMVVTYPNSTAKAALDSNFQNHVPKPRPQTYNGKFERNFNNDDNNCRNVKNSWLLRIVAVFSLAVTIVIFATLHSKLRSSFYDLSVEVRKLQLYIDTHSENMEKRYED